MWSKGEFVIAFTIWASTLGNMTQCLHCQRAGLGRARPRERQAALGKQHTALSGTRGSDERKDSRTCPHSWMQIPARAQGNRLWSQACSCSSSRCYGAICIPRPPPCPPHKQLSGKKACTQEKGLEQIGDTLQFIATTLPYRCQEPDRGVPYQTLG